MVKINPRQRTVIATILLLASFISLMSQTMIITALPVIETEMHQSLEVVQWLTTGYTLLIGIITPLSANLYEKYNNRSFYLAIIGIFVIGTVVGCLATNFWSLLVARLIQAAAGGLLVSFQMTTLVSIYSPEKRGMIMGLSSLVVSFGPAIGPTLAGFFINIWGWRSLFWTVLPIMILLWLIGFFALPAYTKSHAIKIDYLSIVELVVGPGLTLASFTVLTSNLVLGLGMLVVGLLVTTVFLKRQLKLTTPLMDLHVFKSRPFAMMLTVSTFLFMSLLGAEQMVSVFAQNSLHASSAMAGLILFPGALLNALAGAFVGSIYDRHGAKWVVIVGLGLCIVSTIPSLFVNGHTSELSLTLQYAGRMLGIGIAFPPAMSESYRGLKHELVGQATAMLNALRQMAGALAVTMVVVTSAVPTSAITGMRWAMGLCGLFAVIAIVVFFAYLKGGAQDA